MKRIALSDARDRLSQIINEVAHGKERVVLESHGRAKAAIVGLEDLERLENGTDGGDVSMLRWLEEAERRMAVSRRSENASLEALREVREEKIAEEKGLYRRERRSKARRRRGR